MKLFRHKDFDFDLMQYPLTVDLSGGWIEPEVWSVEAPSVDYIEETDLDSKVAFKAALYPQKEIDGKIYSNIMNARLDLLSPAFFSAAEMTALKAAFSTDEDGVIELAKDEIDTALAGVQLFLEGGKWKSAQRENVKIDPANFTFVKQESVDEIKLQIDGYVLTHY